MPVASFRRQSVKRAGTTPEPQHAAAPFRRMVYLWETLQSLSSLRRASVTLYVYGRQCALKGLLSSRYRRRRQQRVSAELEPNPHERVQFDFPIRSADPDPPLQRIGLETIPHNQAKSSSVHVCHVAKPDHGHGHQAWKNKS